MKEEHQEGEFCMRTIRHSYKKQRRDRRGILLLALLFFFFFPYIVSNFSNTEKQSLERKVVPGEIWVSQKKIFGEVKIPLEEYLEGMLAATIPVEYHIEALKAQGIILRTFCMSKVEKKDGSKVVWDDEIKELYLTPEECGMLWGEEKEKNRNKIKQALSETKGMIVVSEGTIPQLPFSRISNGSTRDISEYVVNEEKFSYMKAVACPEDVMAENYIQYVEISIEEFQKKLQKQIENKKASLGRMVLYRDKQEYVRDVEIGEETIDGESFKKALELTSSCFYIEKIDNIIQIKTKGMGHGFGFSQYSADKMAEKGESYEALLYYFFDNISLEKV